MGLFCGRWAVRVLVAGLMNSSLMLTLCGVRQFTTVNAVRNPSKIIGPAVRLLLFQYGLEESKVNPTGPKGNILKNDVLQFIKNSNLKPVPQIVEPVSSSGTVGISLKPEIKPGQKYDLLL